MYKLKKLSGHKGAPLDVWAAGIVLWHLLYGCNPFQVAQCSQIPIHLMCYWAPLMSLNQDSDTIGSTWSYLIIPDS